MHKKSRAGTSRLLGRGKQRSVKDPGGDLDKVNGKEPKAVIRQLRSRLAQAQAKIEELQAHAETDFLLGILNRRGFERELKRSVAYIRRYGASGALIVLDVDRLKPINDTFGHAAGDEVLKAVAAELLRQIRASDVIARVGGDEFVLLLWNLTAEDAAAKAATLEQAIDQLSFEFGGQKVNAGASSGVALLDPHSDAAAQAMMSGVIWSSMKAMRSRSCSLRFFSRCRRSRSGAGE